MRLLLLLVLVSCGVSPSKNCVSPTGNRVYSSGAEYICSSYGCYEVNDICVGRPNRSDKM
jgi:hypothetical protein